MKNILFPTDFSNNANSAFIYALQLAKKMEVELLVLHVYKLPDIKTNLPHTVREVYDSIELEEFENFKDHIPLLRKIAEENELDDVPIKSILEEGDTVSTILDVAKKQESGMIVLGTKGASGLKKIFIGSVAGEVLENATCPVLAVPEDAVFGGKINKIAATTIFEDKEYKVIARVLDIADLFDAELHIVNVDLANTSFYTDKMEELRSLYKNRSNLFFHVLKGHHVEKVVLDFAQKEKIDLLAMFTRKRKFFRELFEYSYTKQMAYHTTIPILAIQSHNIP